MAVTVMQRYELKYLLDRTQTDYLRRKLEGHMQIDQYGLTSIASLYYDTPDARLIRASMDKPIFKEKLRLRSYGVATEKSNVYLELKRKYDGVVYKRRIASTIPQVERFFTGGELDGGDGQIQRELTFFRDYYGTLIPTCLIMYVRTAFFEPGGDLRLTIDSDPRYRTRDLTLTKPLTGQPLLEEGKSILEVKVQGSMPLWLSSILNEGGIYKSSFSKYGEAYRQELLKAKDNTVRFSGLRLLGAA